MESRHLNKMVRASLHYYNTEEEIERFCKHIDRMAETAF
jgi:cysteine desulfurase/selenocysteine lyase